MILRDPRIPLENQPITAEIPAVNPSWKQQRPPPAYYQNLQQSPKNDLATSLLTKSLLWFYVVATLTMVAVLIIKLIWEVVFMHFS